MSLPRRWPWHIILFLLLLSVSLCSASDNDTDQGFPHNPILEQQPNFGRSLLVQVLLDGIVLALTAVLLIHLLFTGQYHWPLAPVNYVLQVSGVVCLFISITATIVVVLNQAFRDSQEWPYMFTYLNIAVPPVPRNTTAAMNTNMTIYEPIVWSTSELAAWYVMDATTSAVVQITHIQFLTLLYPSRLEARLILFLLAPLALVAAAMQLSPIHQSQTVLDIADTIRNTCNAALSVLFTTAVGIWGFLVNRKGAWRTDGGTAAFGVGAIVLAIGSTVLNFIYIPARDQYPWLRHFIWVVILWQSFLGWWWWVGSGYGVGEVEELMRREERRDRKRKARAARRSARKEKAQALWRSTSQSLGFNRRGNGNGDPIEMATLSGRDGAAGSPADAPASSSDIGSSALGTESGFLGRLRATPPLQALSHFYHLLRRAHLAAVHSQTLDYVRRRRAVFARETGPAGGLELDGSVVDPGVVGWGLGSFGLRERERRAMAQAANNEGEGDREDLVDHSTNESDWSGRGVPADATSNPQLRIPRERASSVWWWGPLRRWRLQDSTSY